MNAKAYALMARNGGVLTRPEAYDCGLHPESVRHLLRTGRWVLVRRGVYANGESWAELDDRGRHRLRTRAAVRLMQRHYVASHDSAAYEHGLEILTPPQPHVHVTRQGVTNAWTKAGVKHHLARFHSDQLVVVDGLEVLNVARTAVDIAREHGPPYGEVACDAALRRGVPRKALFEALAIMDFWPHIRRARRAADFADAGAETLIETLGRIIVDEIGLGPVETQFPVQLPDGRVKWCDMRVGCHIFEVDGRVKYTQVAAGGVATDPPHEVVWTEKKRERDIRREGLGMSRIVYSDFWNPQRAVAKARLLEEYHDSVARFGDQLPERLRRSADEIRGRRGA